MDTTWTKHGHYMDRTWTIHGQFDWLNPEDSLFVLFYRLFVQSGLKICKTVRYRYQKTIWSMEAYFSMDGLLKDTFFILIAFANQRISGVHNNNL